MNLPRRQENRCRWKSWLWIFGLGLLICTSCRKTSTAWDVQAKIPIAHSYITAIDLISDSLITVNADNYLSLVYSQQILAIENLDAFSFSDSLLSYTLPIIMTGTLNANTIFCNYNNIHTLNVNSAELTSMAFYSGFLNFSCINPLDQDIVLEISIPKATLNGESLNLTYRIRPADIQQVYQINITDYIMDLRGPKSDSYNQLQIKIIAKTAEDVPLSNFTEGTEFKMSLNFKDLKIKYVQGFFGCTTESTGNESFSVDVFRKLTSSDFQIEKLDAKLRIENQIGCDLQLKVNKLVAENTRNSTKLSFQAPFIGQNINISRAVCQQKDSLQIRKMTQTIALDNSNLKNLIQLLPDKMNYQMDLTMNPLGNITVNHDFMYRGYGLNMYMDIQIPLSLKTQALYYTDTLDYDLSSLTSLQQSRLYLICQNKFPVSIELDIYLMDSVTGQKTVLPLSNATIASGIYKTSSNEENTTVQTIVTSTLDAYTVTLLRARQKLILVAKLNTENADKYVRFKPSDALSVSLSGNFDYSVEVGK